MRASSGVRVGTNILRAQLFGSNCEVSSTRPRNPNSTVSLVETSAPEWDISVRAGQHRAERLQSRGTKLQIDLGVKDGWRVRRSLRRVASGRLSGTNTLIRSEPTTHP